MAIQVFVKPLKDQKNQCSVIRDSAVPHRASQLNCKAPRNLCGPEPSQPESELEKVSARK